MASGPWSSNDPCRLAVLISGNGSNLQAIIDAVRERTPPVRLALVVSNEADAYGLQRAAAAGVPTAVVSHRDHREPAGEREVPAEEGAEAGAGLLVLRHAHPRDHPARAGDPEGLLVGGHEPDRLEHGVGAEAVGDVENALHALVTALGHDVRGAPLHTEVGAGAMAAHQDDGLGAHLRGAYEALTRAQTPQRLLDLVAQLDAALEGQSRERALFFRAELTKRFRSRASRLCLRRPWSRCDVHWRERTARWFPKPGASPLIRTASHRAK